MMKTILLVLIVTFSGLSSIAQKQYYSGTSDGDPIEAEITWKSDGTIVGSYYFTSNSSRVYKLSGTNFVEGEIEIVESLNGKRTANGKLTKTLKKGRIEWGGYLSNTDGSQSYLYLTRSR